MDRYQKKIHKLIFDSCIDNQRFEKAIQYIQNCYDEFGDASELFLIAYALILLRKNKEVFDDDHAMLSREIFEMINNRSSEPVREFNIGDSTSPNSDEKPGFSFVEGEVGSPFPISRTGSSVKDISLEGLLDEILLIEPNYDLVEEDAEMILWCYHFKPSEENIIHHSSTTAGITQQEKEECENVIQKSRIDDKKEGRKDLQGDSSRISQSISENGCEYSVPLIPKINLNYNSDSGLTIEAGYCRVGSKDELIRRKDLLFTGDKKSAIVDNVIRPIPSDISDVGRRLIESGKTIYGQDNLVAFVLEELPNIGREFIVEETDGFKQLSSKLGRMEPFKDLTYRPKIILDYNPESGLTIEAGYCRVGHDDELIKQNDLVFEDAEGFTIIDDVIRPILNDISEVGRRLIESGKTTYSPDSLHKFVLNELPIIRRQFIVEETEGFKRLILLPDTVKPHMDLEFDREEGLKVEFFYQSHKDSPWIPKRNLKFTYDQEFAYVNDTYFPWVNMHENENKYTRASRYFIKFIEIPQFLSDIEKLRLNEAFEIHGLDWIPDDVFSFHPLKVTAHVDYQVNENLTINAGYTRKDHNELIYAEEASISTDSQFAWIDGTFYPVPQNILERTKMMLSQGRSTLSLDRIPYFFIRDVFQSKQDMNVVLSDSAERIDVITEPTFNVEMNEPGWLDFNVIYSLEQEDIPMTDVISSDDSFVRGSDYEWIVNPGNRVTKVADFLKKRQLLPNNRYCVPLYQFATIQDMIEEFGGQKRISEEYEKFLGEITDFKDDDTFQMPQQVEDRFSTLGDYLYPHQRSGIHWMNWLMSHNLHALLADDMGLGKTLQTIATIYLGYHKSDTNRNSLIICPKSVISFWAKEIKKWFPELITYPYVGPSRIKSAWNTFKRTIFIANYDTITRDREHLQTSLQFLVLDEGQNIKNPTTMRSKVIKSINSIHRIALTGTPIENRPLELWSLFEFLMKGYLGSHSTFSRKFGTPIKQGDKEAKLNLQKKIRPFMKRRLKADVSNDLPEKIKMFDYVGLTKEQKHLYHRIQTREVIPLRRKVEGENTITIQVRSSILGIITKLKQVCDHPGIVTASSKQILKRSEKFDLALEKVEEIIGLEEKVVLFSQYLRPLDFFESVFNDRGITYIRLDGSTKNRQCLIEKFNEQKFDVALCSIKAVGTGVTLTGANHVIHFNRWWNPAVENQATDRVHRIGQEKTVYEHIIIVEDTLEEKIDTLLKRKERLFKEIIGGIEGEVQAATRDELFELLRAI